MGTGHMGQIYRNRGAFRMETYLVYFDETGDDGMVQYSSEHFVLTSIYMPTETIHF